MKIDLNCSPLEQVWGAPWAPGSSWRTAGTCCSLSTSTRGHCVLNRLWTVRSFLLRFSGEKQSEKNAASKRGTTKWKPKCQPRSGRHWKRRKWARPQTTQWGLWCLGGHTVYLKGSSCPRSWQIILCRKAGQGWFPFFKRNQKLGLFFSLETTEFLSFGS